MTIAQEISVWWLPRSSDITGLFLFYSTHYVNIGFQYIDRSIKVYNADTNVQGEIECDVTKCCNFLTFKKYRRLMREKTGFRDFLPPDEFLSSTNRGL